MKYTVGPNQDYTVCAMLWMTRSPHKENVCLHQHLKIPAPLVALLQLRGKHQKPHSADFLQGLPCRDSPVLCRGSCSYPPGKNKPSAPMARSKDSARSLAQHPAPGTPGPSQGCRRRGSAGCQDSWAPRFAGWKHGSKEGAEHLSQCGVSCSPLPSSVSPRIHLFPTRL